MVKLKCHQSMGLISTFPCLESFWASSWLWIYDCKKSVGYDKNCKGFHHLSLCLSGTSAKSDRLCRIGTLCSKTVLGRLCPEIFYSADKERILFYLNYAWIIFISSILFPSKTIQGRERIDLSPNGLLTLYLWLRAWPLYYSFCHENELSFVLLKPFSTKQRTM